MSKRVFAVVGVVLMTTALALASASAFSLWGSEQKPSEAQPAQIPPAAPVQPGASLPKPEKPAPAPAGAPEPMEKAGVISSFAPLVKHVMPTVVNVSVVQKVKGFGFEGGGDQPGGDQPGGGDPGSGEGGPGGPQMGPSPFGGGGGWRRRSLRTISPLFRSDPS